MTSSNSAGKEDKDYYNKEYNEYNENNENKIIKTSFHNHTNFSGDHYLQDVTLERIIPKAFEQGLGMIVITDNSNDRAFDYLIKKRKEFGNSGYKIEDMGDNLHNNLLIIENKNTRQILYFPRAIEFHDGTEKMGGHILAIGYNKKIEIEDFKKYSLEEVIDKIHDMGGLAIPAHPFAIKYRINGMGLNNLLRIKDRIDAIEVFNAQAIWLLKEYNHEAEKFADKYRTARICSNDSHRVQDIALTYMNLPKELFDTRSSQNFIESLRNVIAITKDKRFYEIVSHEQYESVFGFICWMKKPIIKRLLRIR